MLKYRAVAFTKAASADEEQAFVVKVLAAESAAAGEKPVAFVSRMYAAPDTYCALQLTILEHMRKEPNAVALFRRRMSGGQGE